MNESRELKNAEQLEELLLLTEEIQEELEQKDQLIVELKTQLNESLKMCIRDSHYTSLPIEKIAYFMKLVGWEQLATQGVPRWQVHKRVAGGSQRRGSVASPV